MTTDNEGNESWEQTKAELATALQEMEQVKAALTDHELTAVERDQLKQDLETLTIEVDRLRTELLEAKEAVKEAEALRRENEKLKLKASKSKESANPAPKLEPEPPAQKKKKLQFL